MAVTFKAVLNNKPNSDGTYSILIRITKNRKPRYASLGYSVKLSDWNEDNKEKPVRSSDKRASVINAKIKAKIAEAELYVTQREINKEPYTVEYLQRLIKGHEEEQQKREDFFTFADKELERIKKKDSYANWKNYNGAVNAVREFVGKDKALSLTDINLTFLKDFHAWLRSAKSRRGEPRSQNTIHTIIKRLSHLLNVAIEDGLMDYAANPFLRFQKIKKAPVYKERLTEDEIRKIEEAQLPRPSLLDDARNIFLMQYYLAGVRVSDMIRARLDDFKGFRHTYKMNKNQKTKSRKLTEKAIQIVEYYESRKRCDNDYVFQFLDPEADYSDKFFAAKQVESKTTIINDNLKKVAELAKVEKKLTSHIARHSFAGMAKKKGLSSILIRDLLGHSSTRITDAYLGDFDEDELDDATDQVFT
jgi:integrase/recombinase XerD